MGAGHKEVFNRIRLIHPRPGESLAATPLGPIGVGSRPLDVARPSDRDDHRRLGDQLGHVSDVSQFATNLGSSRIGKLVLNRQQVFANETADVGLARENSAVFPNFL